jgi:hypothetical protein
VPGYGAFIQRVSFFRREIRADRPKDDKPKVWAADIQITPNGKFLYSTERTTRAQWLADRQTDLLPVPDFQIVFTVPAPVAAIALQNKAVVYDVLLKTAADTIRLIGADPQHLGAETGMIAILHTWGQTLTHHPHAHCLVPSGGLAADGRWVCCRPGFFLQLLLQQERHVAEGTFIGKPVGRSFFPSAFRIASSVFSSTLGRPSCFPSALARASPALTRSWIMARSNSANTPIIWPDHRRRQHAPARFPRANASVVDRSSPSGRRGHFSGGRDFPAKMRVSG